MNKITVRYVALVVAVALIVPTVFAQTGDLPSAFSDIKAETPFYVAVASLREKNLVQGYDDGTFRPYQGVNRAEALAMIMRAFRSDDLEAMESAPHGTYDPVTIDSSSSLKVILPTGTEIILEDTKTGEKTTVKNIKTLQISSGTGAAELAMISPQLSDKPFLDVSNEDWFFDTVATAKALGIVRGESDGTKFNPASPVNLAHALRMMYQAGRIDTSTTDFLLYPPPPGVVKDSWYAADLAYSAWNGILMQREDESTFPPEKNLTRGELAMLIYRLMETKNNKIFGYASWYGDGLSVIRPEKNIDYVNNYLTAAHKTLPFGSLVRVTNMWNDKHVDVVINDRGPFVIGRILDLSKTAFNTIGDANNGIAAVQMEVVMLASQ